MQDRYPGYPEHNRLEAVYDVNADGKMNLATLVFPFSASRPKAVFNKIESTGFNGCTVTHGNAVDYVFESMSGNEIQSSGMSLSADFCFVRKTGKEMPLYFVKNGTSFSAGSLGFNSDQKITVYAKGNEGAISSRGAKIKLSGAGMGSIGFSPVAEVLSSGQDFIEVQLDKGSYRFK